MHVQASPAGFAGLPFHFLTRVTRRSPSTRPGTWWWVVGPGGRPQHVLVHSLARHRPGPRVALTCFAPLRVYTLFQAETTPQPRSERASSARCVRGRCAYDPWHVCRVWAWTDAVSPDRWRDLSTACSPPAAALLGTSRRTVAGSLAALPRRAGLSRSSRGCAVHRPLGTHPLIRWARR